MNGLSIRSSQYRVSFTHFTRHLVRDKKRMAGYLAVSALIVPALGLPGLLDSGPGISAGTGIFQWLTFLLLGLGHLRFLQRRSPSLLKDVPLFSREGWYLILFLSAQVLLLLGLLYLFTDSSLLFMALVSLCAFLLPFTVTHSWLLFGSIPEEQYKVWFDPGPVTTADGTVVDPAVTTGEYRQPGLLISLKMKRRYFDIGEELFIVGVPERMKLGKFFSRFLLEQKNVSVPPIECVDEENNPFGWQFYSPGLAGLTKKFIDPRRSLAGNEIRKGSVIIARRVRSAGPANNLNN